MVTALQEALWPHASLVLSSLGSCFAARRPNRVFHVKPDRSGTSPLFARRRRGACSKQSKATPVFTYARAFWVTGRRSINAQDSEPLPDTVSSRVAQRICAVPPVRAGHGHLERMPAGVPRLRSFKPERGLAQVCLSERYLA